MADLKETIARIRPSIAQIVITARLPDGKPIGGIAGTGFFVSGQQYVATASHVIADTLKDFEERQARDIVLLVNLPSDAQIEGVT